MLAGLFEGRAYSRGGLIRGEGLFDGGPIKLFDKCRIKSSLSMIFFSIQLQEQSKFKHYSLLKSSSSSGVGAYSKGAYSKGAY